MRNWNQRVYRRFLRWRWVFIVPMRNWNNVLHLQNLLSQHRFYRTYEELKPVFPMVETFSIPAFLSYLWGIETLTFTGPMLKLLGFYRTYEELKLSRTRKPNSTRKSFYRTYEELKPTFDSSSGYREFVFIVPMRNWNATGTNRVPQDMLGFYRTYEELKRRFYLLWYVNNHVFIVPMRNWNAPCRGKDLEC